MNTRYGSVAIRKAAIASFMAVASFVLALSPITAGLAAVSHVSGDPTTIRLYAKAVARENALPALVEVTSGDYWFGYVNGPSSTWQLNWGYPRPPFPYQHAVALTSVLRVVGGKVQWTENTFATPCTNGAISCPSSLTPLSIYAMRGADLWATGGDGLSALPSCWKVATGQSAWIAKDYTVNWSPFSVGATQFATAPHYLAMVKHGNQIMVTSTYQYRASGQHVTEIDVINSTSLLFTKSTYHVAATSKYERFSYTRTVTQLATVRTTPPTTHCA